MAVPSGHHIFPFGNSQTQGGTILNNADTSTDRITKALTLIDGVAAAADANTLPSLSASGIYNVAKVLAGGTFAYSEEGKYVIARSSDTLSGVSNTKLLSMGAGQKIAIAQFQGDFGAKLLSPDTETKLLDLFILKESKDFSDYLQAMGADNLIPYVKNMLEEHDYIPSDSNSGDPIASSGGWTSVQPQ